jgi:F-box and leucine-rich repeat protein GRR1
LTHLSLTGVQAFLRDDLLAFCREAPPEFNEHQRDVFCVFSGLGVQRLRVFMNTNGGDDADRETDAFGVNDGTMYHEDEDGDNMVVVTAQANIMAIDEEDEFGNDSEMLGQD